MNSPLVANLLTPNRAEYNTPRPTSQSIYYLLLLHALFICLWALALALHAQLSASATAIQSIPGYAEPDWSINVRFNESFRRGSYHACGMLAKKACLLDPDRNMDEPSCPSSSIDIQTMVEPPLAEPAYWAQLRAWCSGAQALHLRGLLSSVANLTNCSVRVYKAHVRLFHCCHWSRIV